ncbi:MAG: carboxypeptidase-like regulatory domain-containing protein, partial [bacterium]
MKQVVSVIALLTLSVALLGLIQPVQAFTVSGRVLDADGNGVVGAQVYLNQMNHMRGQRPFMGRTVSGDDGSFSFADVPGGDYVISAMHRELGMAAQRIPNLNGDVEGIELVLQGRHGGGGGGDVPTGSITGTVTALNEDGEAVAVEGAFVRAMPARMAHHRGFRPVRFNATTDANGQYTLENVPIGVWIVVAYKPQVGAGR